MKRRGGFRRNILLGVVLCYKHKKKVSDITTSYAQPSKEDPSCRRKLVAEPPALRKTTSVLPPKDVLVLTLSVLAEPFILSEQPQISPFLPLVSVLAVLPLMP